MSNNTAIKAQHRKTLTIIAERCAMSVQSLRGAVEAAIQRASQATGVDFGFLMGTAKRESAYNPQAKAQTSSAAGLFQFVDQTWLGTLKTHGAKHGYARYAALIERGQDGRYRVSGEARKAVMDLRLDPRAASLMAGELASDHASYLRGRVGRAPTGGELYAAHFLGPQGSVRLIQAMQTNPGSSAAALFPEAARANPSIFYRGGRAASVGEVYANLTSTGGSGGVRTRTPEAQQQAFIQYASNRNAGRIQQQEALVEMVLRGSQEPDRLGSAVFEAAMLRAAAYARSRDNGAG